MENRDVVPITLNLSLNEACALAMVVRRISRREFEGALQSWLNEHTGEVFPPDRSAGLACFDQKSGLSAVGRCASLSEK